MRSELRLVAQDAVLLVVDVQEKLHPAMHPELRVSLDLNLARWAEAARILGLPVVVSEQYPRGLGPTIAPVLAALGPAVTPLPKLAFDALAEPALRQALEATGRRSVILAGMEAHICVYQTARAVEASGRRAFVVADAVASRTRENWALGLELARQAGAVVTSTEAALFDMVGVAGTDTFRAISKLVR